MTNRLRCLVLLLGLSLPSSLAAGCGSAASSPSPSGTVPPGWTADQVATLNSLALADDYPLYTMHYQGSYDQLGPTVEVPLNDWACSLFAALADPKGMLYGRNFDWDFSPALLLFTTPKDGYASVSMVDIAYFGYTAESAKGLDKASLEERKGLLSAPLLPFDGMNARGLVVGMAAVDRADRTPDPAKPTVGSIRMIREMLDHAATVDEAVALFHKYNVDLGGGPPIHYLVADASGKAALVEYSKGQLVVTPNAQPWHLATNFTLAEAGSNPETWCDRYATMSAALKQASGSIAPAAAMTLLSSVSQEITQWSAVYQIATGDVQVSMGRDYAQVHTFHLDRA